MEKKKLKADKFLITLFLAILRPSSRGIIFQINDSQVGFHCLRTFSIKSVPM